MSSDEPLLQAREVTASRPGEAGTLQRVLQKTTLDVAAGEILAVVGPSGSGKSTLLRLFNRLLEPESGQILLEGENIQTIDPPLLRARIPLVAQKPFLFSGTVRDNLQASARLRQTKLPDLNDPDLQELLELCQINQSWLDRDARKLSVGQQQRICLARAMVGPCQALLLDEPTSALDRPTADLMAQTFRKLAEQRGLAIIFVSHDLRLTERCADRVALLLDGAVVETGTTAQLLHHPNTESARQFLSSEPVENGGEPG
ncbi:MAG: ATP-binding cassette domain-containing protein [Deltaproteobacteria bacterium]|nr:ATP-binding cassette domain-containing protein [Deltaproteobacteria bacterium]